MYTACAWLAGIAAAAARQEQQRRLRELRLFMIAPLSVGSLALASTSAATARRGALSTSRSTSSGITITTSYSVISTRLSCRTTLPAKRSTNASDAHQHHAASDAADRARRVDERLERDGDEGEREGQDEAEQHLARGRDAREPAVGRRRCVRRGERLQQRLLVGDQHVAHQRERRLDARQRHEQRRARSTSCGGASGRSGWRSAGRGA